MNNRPSILIIDSDKRRDEKIKSAVLADFDDALIVRTDGPEKMMIALDEDSFDIAFLSVDMDSKSEYALSSALKKSNRFINLILISDGTATSQEAIRLHASGYIKSDFDKEEIGRELRNLLFPVV